MFRKLLCLVLCSLLAYPSYGQVVLGNANYVYVVPRDATHPATYVDASGVTVPVTTSNTPRYSYGYYDTTAFHATAKTLMTEAAATNLLTRTDGTASSGNYWTGWNASTDGTVVANNTVLANPYLSITGTKSQRLQATVTSGTNRQNSITSTITSVGSVLVGNTVTASALVYSSTGNTNANLILSILEYNAAGGYLGIHQSTSFTASSTPILITYTVTMTDLNCSRVVFDLGSRNMDSTSVQDYAISMPQLEVSASATSFIPTTTTALTRNAESPLSTMTVKSGINTNSSLLQSMLQYSGLTFYKDTSSGTTDADFSDGSKTGIYTRTGGATAPTSYLDTNGIMNKVTTSDVMLTDGGTFDATGFHAGAQGYHAWRSSTNLLTRTDGTAYAGGVWTGWASVGGSITGTRIKTNTLIPELTSISGATSQRIQYTGVAGDVSNKTLYFDSTTTGAGSFTTGDTATLSYYARSLTGNAGVSIKALIDWRDNAGAEISEFDYSSDIASSLTTTWRKFTYTATLSGATGTQLSMAFEVAGIENGDLVDIEIALPQTEKQPYATPFIPTTTAALTRNGDVLKYENAGNSTKDAETIIIQFTPGSTFANDRNFRSIYTTETVNRRIYKAASDAVTTINMNVNSGDNSFSSTVMQKNIAYVFAAVGKHSSPYNQIYINGTSEATDTVHDWTNPNWGTYFHVGDTSGVLQLDGNIKRIAKYNRALTSTEISAISTLWANTP